MRIFNRTIEMCESLGLGADEIQKVLSYLCDFKSISACGAAKIPKDKYAEWDAAYILDCGEAAHWSTYPKPALPLEELARASRAAVRACAGLSAGAEFGPTHRDALSGFAKAWV